MRRLNIVDLFAGTGGMGLAALSSAPFKQSGRIVWAAELSKRYVGVISRNYETFKQRIGSPEQIQGKVKPVDLSNRSALESAKEKRRRWGQIDLLLAGPPCQGFSLANRMSRDHSNPLNQLSLRTVDYVRALEPQIFILENVPGIRTLHMAQDSSETTTDILKRRLKSMGYSVSVVVLDAASYGVPQFRLRSFLIAAKGHAKLPIDIAPAPTHGPGGRLPYVTVKDALDDLPRIENGSSKLSLSYRKDANSTFQRRMRRYAYGKLTDHLTSKHSEYVLERYVRIPQGGNWTSIRRLMSNYAEPERTHENIYHRLDANSPARTIGNFRKSMTIHPRQTRGLSLREAARLQSIPDWFSFADPEESSARGGVPGLNAYQQQIGNAMSYLLTEKLVSHVASIVEM